MRGMYSVRDFGDMIADTGRMEAYVQALRRTIRPGDVVVDIGTGTGIFALLACQFGARKVYAIDPNPAIDVARRVVRDNGFADRIELIAKLSTEVEVREQADVIVSDVRGVVPTFSRSIATLMDARSRWLRPGGTLIPLRDSLRVAVVESEALYRPIVRPWDELNYGLDLSAAKRAATDARYNDREAPVGPEQLLTESAIWASIDYSTVTSTDVSGSVTLTTSRRGVGHGLVVWFDAELTESERFSSGPGRACIYFRAFFPWREPVNLEEGVAVHVDLRAVAAADDYVFSWRTRADGKEFSQTDFFSQSMSDVFLLGADNRPASLEKQGNVTLHVLQAFRDGASLTEAAAQLEKAFPRQFTGPDVALASVREVARKYASRIA